MQKLTEEEARILAVMIQARERYFSAREVESSTMVLRKMTEAGWVEMSLSKAGHPHYVITDAGAAAVLADW